MSSTRTGPAKARRVGRWTYNSDSALYGEAGWHLDGSPVVIDFMPGMTDCEPGRGLYLGYGWPGRTDGWIVSKYCREAMRVVEEEWDEYATAAAAGACRCWHYPVRLHGGHCCFADDSLCHPVPADMRADVLARLRAAWDEPFTAGPADEEANAARARQARYLADVILCSPPGTVAGGLTIASAGWPEERGHYADSAAGPQGRVAALGRHEYAVLTSDGRPAARHGWCGCAGPAGPEVRYEAWSKRGCEAHGFVCAGCRKLTQTG